MSATDIDSLQHFRVTTGSSGHVWVTFDKADSSTNTLSSDVMDELERVVEHLEGEPGLPGIVIRSAKSSGFILGADVNEFVGLQDPEQAAALAARGQELFNRIEDLPCPSVAILNGYTLGGGLELALACRYRVAIEAYDRCIGLPEVQLGIHPGFGGTVRTVRCMGTPRALDLMLTGRSLSPFEARAAGLVDKLAAAGEAEAAALRLLRRDPGPRRPPWYLRLMNFGPVRPLIARRLHRQVEGKARAEHYPAPHALIDLWQQHGAVGAAAYRAEATSIGELLVSQTCKNLVRLFLLRERLRNLAPRSRAVKHLHVVGGGVMGGDIAAWGTLQGLTVSVQDREQRFLEPAFERARLLFAKRLRAPGAAQDAGRRLLGDIEGAHVGDADIVIEAIIEDLDAKRTLFAELEQKAGSATILATNTSSIRIESIASALSDPGRLLGIHFFNPVAQMPLVEVIRAEATDPELFDRALAFVTQIGKLPLPCRSAPGFLVNRILMPYMLEALIAHEEGHAIETVDAAARGFGMPVGPIELADQVGLDVALHVAEILSAELDQKPPQVLSDMVADGRLGRKSDKGGFYSYRNKEIVRASAFSAPDAALTDRLILTLVNEAAACLHDRIVDDGDLLDAGVVFGTGFAPYSGGPVNYARQCGVDDILARLRKLEAAHGPRFAPHPSLQDLLQE